MEHIAGFSLRNKGSHHCLFSSGGLVDRSGNIIDATCRLRSLRCSALGGEEHHPVTGQHCAPMRAQCWMPIDITESHASPLTLATTLGPSRTGRCFPYAPIASCRLLPRSAGGCTERYPVSRAEAEVGRSRSAFAQRQGVQVCIQAESGSYAGFADLARTTPNVIGELCAGLRSFGERGQFSQSKSILPSRRKQRPRIRPPYRSRWATSYFLSWIAATECRHGRGAARARMPQRVTRIGFSIQQQAPSPKILLCPEKRPSIFPTNLYLDTR